MQVLFCVQRGKKVENKDVGEAAAMKTEHELYIFKSKPEVSNAILSVCVCDWHYTVCSAPKMRQTKLATS